MRSATCWTLGTTALFTFLVACGGGADAGKGTATPTSGGVDPSAPKLSSKPPPPSTNTAAAPDKSPKTVCASAKAISLHEEPAPNQSEKQYFSKEKAKAFGDELDRSRNAKDTPFTMQDLKALEGKGQWRELVSHLDDVPPAKRDKAWEALVDKSATELMSQTSKEKDPFEAFYTASHLVDKYPQLKNNKTFMQKRLEAATPAFKECFAKSYRGTQCVKAAQEFVNTGDSPDAAFAVAKIVRGGQNHHVAIPFFEKGLEGRQAGAAECGDEDLKLSVVSALALPPDYDNAKVGRKVASGVCFDKLKPAIESEFKDGSSYYTDNACSVLKAKNAL